MTTEGTLIDGCPDLVSAVYDAKKKKIMLYPVHANRASEAGHPCERYLVYSRTRWEEKLLHSVEAQFIFEGGALVEEMAVQDLKEAGFTIVEQNRPFAWRQYQLTGHVDFKIVVGNYLGGEKSKTYPIEVKGLQSFDFDKLNCVEDFLESRKSWIRKYPAQLALYLLMSNEEVGCFYLKRVPGFRPKQIWIHLDYTFAEDILQKIERVNKHVVENTVPDPIDDYEICQYCSFLHICLPNMKGKEIEIISDPEIEEALNEYFALQDAVKRHEKAATKWRAAVEGKEKLMIGEFLITGKWIVKKPYTVNYPEQRIWRPKVLLRPKNTTTALPDGDTE